MKKIACVLFELEDNESIESVINKIRDVGNVEMVDSVELKQISWEDKLKNTLNNLGINPSLKAYSTLLGIMRIVNDNPKHQTEFFMKEVYAEYKEKTGVSYTTLDRRVRTAIDTMYKKHSIEYINNILKITNEKKPKVTATYFLSALAQLIFE